MKEGFFMIDKTKLEKCRYHRCGHFELENYTESDKHYEGFVDPNKLNEIYDEKYELVPSASFEIDQEYIDKFDK